MAHPAASKIRNRAPEVDDEACPDPLELPRSNPKKMAHPAASKIRNRAPKVDDEACPDPLERPCSNQKRIAHPAASKIRNRAPKGDDEACPDHLERPCSNPKKMAGRATSKQRNRVPEVDNETCPDPLERPRSNPKKIARYAASKQRNRTPKVDDGACPRQPFQKGGSANQIKFCEPRFIICACTAVIVILLTIFVAGVLTCGLAQYVWTLREERLDCLHQKASLQESIQNLHKIINGSVIRSQVNSWGKMRSCADLSLPSSKGARYFPGKYVNLRENIKSRALLTLLSSMRTKDLPAIYRRAGWRGANWNKIFASNAKAGTLAVLWAYWWSVFLVC